MKQFTSIYEFRRAGREFCCDTEGSTHYKSNETNIEPAEYAIQNGTHEDFFSNSIIKYITRFKITRNLNDLKKVSDYAHLLCGVEIITKAPQNNIPEEF